MNLLLTGTTGNVGGEIAKLLTERGVAFRALARRPDRVKVGNVVKGDLDDPASLDRALAGIERAFLVTPSTAHAEQQQRAFVEAASRQGVKHIVKLSQWAASADSPVRFLRYHAAIEAMIRDAKLDFTFLRPNLFMQALLGFAGSIRTKDAFFAAAAGAAISAIDVRDIAAVAAEALTADGHAGRTHDLTGPEALTHAAMATKLGEARGKPVRFVDVPEPAMRDALVEAGMLPWQADGLIEDYAHYRRGEASTVTDTVARVTGHPARTFSAFAHDHAKAFT